MTRRLAVVLAALGAVGFGWVLWTLHGVFESERVAANAAVDARRRVLDRHAADGFERRVARRLRQAPIARALADPLAPFDGLYSRRGGRVLLPPTPVYAERQSSDGADYAALLDPRHRPEAAGPWGERLALRGRLLDALARDDMPAVEAAMRAFLAHRLRHVLAPQREIPSTLAVVSGFVEAVHADPRLLRAVLYDGFEGGAGQGAIEGLQRSALRHRAAFVAEDFERLAAAIVALSERGEVPREAFERALRPPAPPPVPDDVTAPRLIDDGRWYVAPNAGRVDGVRVDPEAERAAVEESMRRGALLEDGETLRFDPRAPVPVSVHSPDWVERPARARATWRLKVGLLWSCALLAAAVVGLVLLEVRRRRRFVELKSDFISAVSHELRTPLAAIRLMAETLERRLGDVPRARDYPARIVREVDGLGFLVENLLSFNRVDKGRWVARRRPVALAEIVGRIREGVEAAFDREVEWQTAGLDRWVDADPALIELLVANLVRNAVQHSSGPLRLTVEANERGGRVRLSIADDGPGIPAEARGHIFEPFYRGPGRTSRGSGLGLALGHRIAGLHGGRLTLLRTGDDGTAFEVDLPAASGREDPGEASEDR